MKKIFRRILLVVFLLSFFGCTSMNGYMPKTAIISIPEINVISENSIGNELLSKVNKYEYEAIEVNTINKKIPNGIYIANRYNSDKIEYAYTKNNSIYEQVYLIEKDGKIQCNIGYTNTPLINTIKLNSSEYKKTHFYTYNEDSFKQTLIYVGKTKEEIHFVYREYLNDMARPAFTLNIIYDINGGSILNVKDAKIEIINAANDLIEYKVLSNF